MKIYKTTLEFYESLTPEEKTRIDDKYKSHLTACRNVGFEPSSLSSFIDEYRYSIGTPAQDTIMDIEQIILTDLDREPLRNFAHVLYTFAEPDRINNSFIDMENLENETGKRRRLQGKIKPVEPWKKKRR